MKKLGVCVVFLFVTVGCGTQDVGSDAGDGCVCDPGQSVSCDCSNGESGTRQCRSDCEGWLECQCSISGTDVSEQTDTGHRCDSGYVWDSVRGSCVKLSGNDVAENCDPSHSVKKCQSGINAIYWQDACGNWTDLVKQCGNDQYCDSATTTCKETPDCESDDDCPDSTCGSASWSQCSDFSDECDETGTQTKSCSNYECSGGECVEHVQNSEQNCTRNTDDEDCQGGGWCSDGVCIVGCKTNSDCDSKACDSWGVCGGYSNDCDETGIQERTCYSAKCNASTHVCEYSPNTDTQSCTRDTEGTTCDDTDYTSWGTCGSYSDTCDESGTQTRTKTSYACLSGACKSSSSTESQSCSRDTDGTSCGSTSYGSWGTCGSYSDTCDESGTQTRSKTTYACANSSCKSSSSTDSQSCSRDTDGTSCGSTSYGTWGTCGSFSDTCDESGTKTRTNTTYACSSGTCKSSNTTESQSCNRDQTGVTCKTTSYGSWENCGWFSSTCDETGTQERATTIWNCYNGVCSSTPATEERSCTRDTDGDSCGNTSIEYCVSGSCTGCDTSGGGTLGSGTDCDPSSALTRYGTVKYNQPQVWYRAVNDSLGCSVDSKVIVSGFSGDVDIGLWYKNSSGSTVDITCSTGTKKTSSTSLCDSVPCCVSNSTGSSETIKIGLPSFIGDGSGTFYVKVVQTTSSTNCTDYTLSVPQY